MSLGGIIAKLFGKSKTQSSAPTGWGGWLDTPEGKRWEATGEKVYDELEAATVDVHARHIVVRDGAKRKRLTINQVVRRIVDKTSEDAGTVREHVLQWLEETGESDDDERDDGVDIDYEIRRWVDDLRRSPSG